MCHFYTNFAHIIKFRTVLCNGEICPPFVTSQCVMTNFISSLSHLTLFVILL